MLSPNESPFQELKGTSCILTMRLCDFLGLYESVKKKKNGGLMGQDMSTAKTCPWVMLAFM